MDTISEVHFYREGVRAQCEQPVHNVFTGGDAARRHRAPSHFCSCELFGTLGLGALARVI